MTWRDGTADHCRRNCEGRNVRPESVAQRHCERRTRGASVSGTPTRFGVTKFASSWERSIHLAAVSVSVPVPWSRRAASGSCSDNAHRVTGPYSAPVHPLLSGGSVGKDFAS